MNNGIIIEAYDKDGSTCVTIRDKDSNETSSLKLEQGYDIQFGDSVRWEADTAYWTPANRAFDGKAIKVHQEIKPELEQVMLRQFDGIAKATALAGIEQPQNQDEINAFLAEHNKKSGDNMTAWNNLVELLLMNDNKQDQL